MLAIANLPFRTLGIMSKYMPYLRIVDGNHKNIEAGYSGGRRNEMVLGTGFSGFALPVLKAFSRTRYIVHNFWAVFSIPIFALKVILLNMVSMIEEI